MFNKNANSLGPILSSVKSNEEEDVMGKTNLSLVKLMKKGLLLFSYPCDHKQNSVDVLAKILHSLELGDFKPPQCVS